MTELTITALREAYVSGRTDPVTVMQEIIERIQRGPSEIWIHVENSETLLEAARSAARRFQGSKIRSSGKRNPGHGDPEQGGLEPDKAGRPDGKQDGPVRNNQGDGDRGTVDDQAPRPLEGIPFAIKDNIDLAGVPTTAGCPEYSYVAQTTSTVVQALLDAGAIPVGKTNMDQFATGLVGTRSPYGEVPNSFEPQYISGGSSSGSAVAVSLGQVCFSLGTDTAGSGRVPASLNHILGIKPAPGQWPMDGVVPACRSLDCVSLFTHNAKDGATLLGVLNQNRQREESPVSLAESRLRKRRIGMPPRTQLRFQRPEMHELYNNALDILRQTGMELQELDFSLFFEAARLLYEGPYVAERYAAVGEFIESQGQQSGLNDITSQIILAGKDRTAVEAYRAIYRIDEIARELAESTHGVDAFLCPTNSSVYLRSEIQADPLSLNSEMGYYTNFMNLLGMAAVTVPVGFLGNRVPWGLTLFSRGLSLPWLLETAHTLHKKQSGSGRALYSIPPFNQPDQTAVASEYIPIVVCGAHMNGMALNYQLKERGAFLNRSTRTAPVYRFFALEGDVPRPGLVHQGKAGGHSIEVEVWDMPAHRWGDFIQGISAPLCIGSVLLEDNTMVRGFLCESFAVEEAKEISDLKSWRNFIATL